MLNPVLIERQGLTIKNVATLEALHSAMDALKATSFEDIVSTKEFVQEVEDIEFAMQREWKFSEDDKFHTHWYQCKACKCPVLDNQDMTGLDSRVINMSCPLHGNT